MIHTDTQILSAGCDCGRVVASMGVLASPVDQIPRYYMPILWKQMPMLNAGLESRCRQAIPKVTRRQLKTRAKLARMSFWRARDRRSLDSAKRGRRGQSTWAEARARCRDGRRVAASRRIVNLPGCSSRVKSIQSQYTHQTSVLACEAHP